MSQLTTHQEEGEYKILKHKKIMSLIVVAVLCILLVGLEAQAVITDNGLFPVKDGLYKKEVGSVTYPVSLPGSVIDIELVSMSFIGRPNSVKPRQLCRRRETSFMSIHSLTYSLNSI